MKIFAIGDLHLSVNNPKPMDIFGPQWEGYVDKIFSNWREKVGEEDLVLLPGDFSWAMKLEDAKADFEMLKKLPGTKIMIRGNHDYWWPSISNLRKALPEKFYAIQNDAMKFGDVIICGTRGWTVPEPNAQVGEDDERIYKREVIRLELTLQAAKNLQTNGEKIVCMMHYPPCNFHREESDFTRLIETYGVSAVVYGHLHGYKKVVPFFKMNDVDYYLTSCDMVENKLVEIMV